MPSVINSDNGAVSGSAGLKFDSADDGILHIQNSGNTSVVVSESGMRVPIGTTAERPASPQNGMIRYNTDTLELEAYANGAWKSVAGVEPALKLDFDEYQFDGRISFTRATSGTYFDRNGVLRTAGSGVPRFDHRLENGSWVNKGLLIEEARTNLAQRSEEIDYFSKIGVAVTNDNTTAPDGTNTAEKVLETTAFTEHYFFFQSSINMTSTNYAFSFFVKAAGRTKGTIQIIYVDGSPFDSVNANFDLTEKTITAAGPDGSAVALQSSIQECNDSWFRITLSGRTSRSGNTQFRLLFRNDANSATYTADTTKGFYVWGIQLELGAFPTSYIKTTTATVTRNADVATMTGTNFSSWYNATEGTVFWQGDYNTAIDSNGFRTFYDIADNGASANIERNTVLRQISTSNDIRYKIFDNSVSQVDSTLVSSTSGIAKTATTYKANDFAYSLNGSTPSTDTSATVPTVAGMSLGGSYSGTSGAGGTTSMLNGHIAKFYYWPNRLPNSKLQSLTS